MKVHNVDDREDMALSCEDETCFKHLLVTIERKS